jgi:3-deoxy-alpha-D-manno-octulosonate 8-oxidase
LQKYLSLQEKDCLKFIATADEPTTDFIDQLCIEIREGGKDLPCAIVGIGGGITLDTTKAVSNLLTNGGKAEDYQGWDLVKKPGVYKIGVPTISGTGAESSRTCVMTNLKKNIKLGMNSPFSTMDHLILDPDLSASVPRNQYFYTGMDTYIHCIESLNGRFRHSLADSYSREAINLCREVFSSPDMQTADNRERMMVASYLGGASIANTYVGVVHPLSAGLSTVLHLHHCIANCIAMNVLEDFYPSEVHEFKLFVKRQDVVIPSGVCADLDSKQFDLLYESMIVHEKPLINALGPDYRTILTPERVKDLYRRM